MVFKDLEIRSPEKAFSNAIEKGLKDPENYMYMYSKDEYDYFKHIDTRSYIKFRKETQND